MAYEVDFVGTAKVAKDYDAITFRYWSENRWIVCVFDGGTSEAGEALSQHIGLYYFKEPSAKEIDYVFCSHPDLDHTSGLKSVLQNYTVKNLVMNRPWLYLDELYDKVKDGRITKESLERTLREKYKFIDELEELAKEQNCKIIQGLTGASLPQEMVIVSPTKEFYVQQLIESDKTPAMDASVPDETPIWTLVENESTRAKWAQAIWGRDDIREGEGTSAENETSIVLRVHPNGDDPFLLVGDVGCQGLTAALDYAEAKQIPLNQCAFVQIPHHGGRHNVSPSVLDRLVGNIVSKETIPKKTAFVSVGKGSDHPRKCVVNAYIHRGCNVFESRESTVTHHSVGMPERGWGAAKKTEYSKDVEPWDD